jgi:hypothetical protein
MHNKDIVTSSQVVTEWYEAMDVMAVHVPPMATTILHAVLDRYEIHEAERDVWQTFLRLDIDELSVFYASLTDEERAYVDRKRAESWRNIKVSRELLKG